MKREKEIKAALREAKRLRDRESAYRKSAEYIEGTGVGSSRRQRELEAQVRADAETVERWARTR